MTLRDALVRITLIIAAIYIAWAIVIWMDL